MTEVGEESANADFQEALTPENFEAIGWRLRNACVEDFHIRYSRRDFLLSWLPTTNCRLECVPCNPPVEEAELHMFNLAVNGFETETLPRPSGPHVVE